MTQDETSTGDATPSSLNVEGPEARPDIEVARLQADARAKLLKSAEALSAAALKEINVLGDRPRRALVYAIVVGVLIILLPPFAILISSLDSPSPLSEAEYLTTSAIGAGIFLSSLVSFVALVWKTATAKEGISSDAQETVREISRGKVADADWGRAPAPVV
jgi:hypothetical protein